MYAELIVTTHPGINQHSAEKFYTHLQGYPDAEVEQRARHLLRNGLDAADVLWV